MDIWSSTSDMAVSDLAHRQSAEAVSEVALGFRRVFRIVAAVRAVRDAAHLVQGCLPTRSGRVGGRLGRLRGAVLAQNNFYVSFFVDEDLPTILKSSGQDSLIIGTAFVHHDFAEELDFMGILQQRVDRGELSQTALCKMTYDNPKRLYAL
jgi:hypothetical protein